MNRKRKLEFNPISHGCDYYAMRCAPPEFPLKDLWMRIRVMDETVTLWMKVHETANLWKIKNRELDFGFHVSFPHIFSALQP
jgi:hypothetical protein